MLHTKRTHCKSKNHRFWNDTEEAVKESLMTIVAIHSGLFMLKDCNAILRRDYNAMPGKVKLISGGGAGNEPTHAGFVGPGLLTAAVIGNVFSSPTSSAILKVIEELGTNHSPGVLLIVQNYTGYRINFSLAKLQAESKGIKIKMIIVKDDVCLTSFKKTAGKRGLTGTLFVHKIAGAMAEEGKSLDDIYNLCNRIIDNGDIATISICTEMSLSNCACTYKETKNEVEIGNGIHGELGVSQVFCTSFKNIASTVINSIINVDVEKTEENTQTLGMFHPGQEVAVIINNLGGCSQMECNIFAMEILRQLELVSLHVNRIYMGTLMTCLDTSGFLISLLNISSNQELIKYLDADTLAPAWPKILSLNKIGFDKEEKSELVKPGLYSQGTSDDRHSIIEIKGPVLSEKAGQILLMIITYACEALIACSEQLNKMDEDSGDGDCGTTITRGATAIISAIKENKINSRWPFVTFTHVSHIIERTMGGLQGGLYTLFFNSIAQIFAQESREKIICADLWLKALITGNKTLSEFGGASQGDRTMLDPLLAAQSALTDALQQKYHPIYAFGEAVKAAENCAIDTLHMKAHCGRVSFIKCKEFQHPDPGAHAVGIWMRAVYEGIKLKFSCECDI